MDARRVRGRPLQEPRLQDTDAYKDALAHADRYAALHLDRDIESFRYAVRSTLTNAYQDGYLDGIAYARAHPDAEGDTHGGGAGAEQRERDLPATVLRDDDTFADVDRAITERYAADHPVSQSVTGHNPGWSAADR